MDDIFEKIRKAKIAFAEKVVMDDLKDKGLLKEPGIVAGEPHIMRCECQNWARTDQSLISKHHKSCPKYSPEEDAAEIIHALIRGIECWASDEDGVHPECWKAYQTACHAIGLSHHIKHP